MAGLTGLVGPLPEPALCCPEPPFGGAMEKKVVDDAGRRSSVAECGGSRKVWWWRVRSRSGGRLRDEGGEIGRSLRRTLRRDSNPQLHRSWIPSLG